MSAHLITARKLSISHGNHLIFNELNLDICEGEWVEFIGPNSSGKSSLLNAFYGLANDISGQLNVLDFSLNPVQKDFQSARRKMGFFSTRIPLLDDRTVRANLAIALNAADRVKDLSGDQGISELLSKFGLLDKISNPVSDLSSSEKAMVMLARTMIHKPRLILLDAAFDSLDDQRVRMVKGELENMVRRDGCCLISTGVELKPHSPEQRKIMFIEDKQVRIIGS
jgi:ABC-type multidrug transport system ATPase subunit